MLESQVTQRSRGKEPTQPWRLSKDQRDKEYLEIFQLVWGQWYLLYWRAMRFLCKSSRLICKFPVLRYISLPGILTLTELKSKGAISLFLSLSLTERQRQRNKIQARLYSFFSFWLYKKLKHFHGPLSHVPPVPSGKVHPDLSCPVYSYPLFSFPYQSKWH